MNNEANLYRVPAQIAFETVIMGAELRISDREFVEIFEAASRNARWYADREDVVYHHRTLNEAKTLRDWFLYWHESHDVELFRYWVHLNLKRASDSVPLFALTEEDAQTMARELELPSVTPEQMERVRKWVDSSFDDWSDILETAVIESKRELEA